MLFKENLKKITTNPTAQKILSLGRFGRALRHLIGAALGITGLGVDLAKDYGRDLNQRTRKKCQQNPDKH